MKPAPLTCRSRGAGCGFAGRQSDYFLDFFFFLPLETALLAFFPPAFLALNFPLLRGDSIAAWAAAKRAMGTRKGLQLT